MAEGLSASARQANQQSDQVNKYARVIAEATAAKRTREDLIDDRRIMHRTTPTPWTPIAGET
jgi:hypothetical protein